MVAPTTKITNIAQTRRGRRPRLPVQNAMIFYKQREDNILPYRQNIKIFTKFCRDRRPRRSVQNIMILSKTTEILFYF